MAGKYLNNINTGNLATAHSDQINSSPHAKKIVVFPNPFFFRTYTPPPFNAMVSKNVLFTCCCSVEYDWKLNSPIHYLKKGKGKECTSFFTTEKLIPFLA